MKKLLLAALLSLSAFAGDTIVPPNEKYKLTTSDIQYQYNFTAKKCEATTFEYRQIVINSVRSESALISEKYENKAGTTYYINYDYKGEEYMIALMDTFGQCRFYEDLIVKRLDVQSTSYIKLKPIK